MNPARIVLDASIAVAWCFEDEKTPDTERLLDALTSGTEALVPALWPYEVANALLAAERRKRITVAQAAHFLSRLSDLGISIDDSHPSRIFEQVISQAREWNLTVYDASYLELALREGLPLATLDGHLKSAANSAGIPIAHLGSRKHTA
ncbi:MAG: hypothetical protein A3A86_01205 [Elusimicrobia bacterium RIFCSPLOWO2_01_FULL_60_11]|nr:MAG: hypothetical protein A3A86_01205 [Elusimicrobia bacterium RIFCSPLOWO2_01_FULL_60_11]